MEGQGRSVAYTIPQSLIAKIILISMHACTGNCERQQRVRGLGTGQADLGTSLLRDPRFDPGSTNTRGWAKVNANCRPILFLARDFAQSLTPHRAAAMESGIGKSSGFDPMASKEGSKGVTERRSGTQEYVDTASISSDDARRFASTSAEQCVSAWKQSGTRAHFG